MSASEIQLLPCTSEDIPRMHDIGVAAFLDDTHTVMKVWEKGKQVHEIGRSSSSLF